MVLEPTFLTHINYSYRNCWSFPIILYDTRTRAKANLLDKVGLDNNYTRVPCTLNFRRYSSQLSGTQVICRNYWRAKPLTIIYPTVTWCIHGKLCLKLIKLNTQWHCCGKSKSCRRTSVYVFLSLNSFWILSVILYTTKWYK